MTMRAPDDPEKDAVFEDDGAAPAPRVRSSRRRPAARSISGAPEDADALPGGIATRSREGSNGSRPRSPTKAKASAAREAASPGPAGDPDAAPEPARPEIPPLDAGPEARLPAPALSVAKLSFAYRDRVVLDDVSFRVERGVFTALLGPNGAGKTTLFSLITRLFDSGHGAIEILGRDPKRDGAMALAPLGVVFQRETLDLDLTVRQNLHYFAALHGLRSREALLRMEEELAAIDVLDKIDTRVRDLNGGHRRRVEIARALLHRPELLLLDEATVGLDVPSRRAIVARVHALASDRGIGVLWTTHLIDEVFDEDALLILHQGRIVASGRVATVVAASGRRSLAETFDALTGRPRADGEETR